MVVSMNRNKVVLVSAITAAALGAAGLAALALPAGAGIQPDLPEVSAADLLSSVLAVQPPAMAGTIDLDNALGLPTLPGLPSQLGNGSTEIRVWYDGDGRSRVALPERAGERTIVNDGSTVWTWDSAGRTVTKVDPEHAGQAPHQEITDPAQAARRMLAVVEPTSEISVDGTATVADRPAYELVVSPKPTERTLLREVRVAVDSETRLPLRLQVLANGTNDPVLSIGFDSLRIGPQDADLFRFSPPAGASVTERDPAAERTSLDGLEPDTIGDGWDTVLITRLPADLLSFPAAGGPAGGTPGLDPKSFLDRLGTEVSGPWGAGRLISTTVVSVIVTDDGRVATGAVPQQVLVEALSR